MCTYISVVMVFWILKEQAIDNTEKSIILSLWRASGRFTLYLYELALLVNMEKTIWRLNTTRKLGQYNTFFVLININLFILLHIKTKQITLFSGKYSYLACQDQKIRIRKLIPYFKMFANYTCIRACQ